ncbi:hypothetical protein BB560_002063 [Smittium megazygosporum]|uniref:Uncharacterized protein n=1 Tax=Smittium megazygosporum TaxID=133381 RepID=A0A2T9ZFU9_9FUNG|nr:hypothetical protein BB560_002063 [Smittium megazygosporum]
MDSVPVDLLEELAENEIPYSEVIEGVFNLFKPHCPPENINIVSSKLKAFLGSNPNRTFSKQDIESLTQIINELYKYCNKSTNQPNLTTQKSVPEKNITHTLKHSQKFNFSRLDRPPLESNQPKKLVASPQSQFSNNDSSFNDLDISPATVAKIASEFTTSTDNLHNAPKNPNTDAEWASLAAKNVMSRLGPIPNHRKLSPTIRKTSSLNTISSIQSQLYYDSNNNPGYSNVPTSPNSKMNFTNTNGFNDSEFQTLIKERDLLKLELEKLQSKHLSITRDLELRNSECYEAQQKLNEISTSENLQLKQLQQKLGKMAELHAKDHEKAQMEEEVKRLALQLSNSEAEKQKLLNKLNKKSSKVDSLVSQISSIAQEKSHLKSLLDSKSLQQSHTSNLPESSKELQVKLEETQILSKKLEDSQRFIKVYEKKIDNLLSQLDSSKRLLEKYSKNPLNQTDQPGKSNIPNNTPTNSTNDDKKEHGNSNANNVALSEQIIQTEYNTKLLFDLFSNCLPNDFYFINTCWNYLSKNNHTDTSKPDQKSSSNNSSNNQSSNLSSNILSNLLQVEFIRTIHLFLSENDSNGSFYSFLLKSKYTKLLITLKPVIASYKKEMANKKIESRNSTVALSNTLPSNQTTKSGSNSFKANSESSSSVKNEESNDTKLSAGSSNSVENIQESQAFTVRVFLIFLIISTIYIFLRAVFPPLGNLPSWMSRHTGLLNSRLPSDGYPSGSNRNTFSSNTRDSAFEVIDDNDNEPPVYVTPGHNFKHGKALYNYLLNKFRIDGWNYDGADYPT